MLGTPKIWLLGAVLGCVGLFLVASHFRHQATLQAIAKASESKGTAVADAKHATTALTAAKEAADDWRAAEAETPVDASREYWERLCARSSSCTDREKYRTKYGSKK